MLKEYFNYVQNVLGAQSFLLPFEVEEESEAIYHFAVTSLNDASREILNNIIKALRAKKYDVLELNILRLGGEAQSAQSPTANIIKTKSTLIIFGIEAARFLIPEVLLKIGETRFISGSQILLTHSIDDMRERPELKREAWQHLKAFVNED